MLVPFCLGPGKRQSSTLGESRRTVPAVQLFERFEELEDSAVPDPRFCARRTFSGVVRRPTTSSGLNKNRSFSCADKTAYRSTRISNGAAAWAARISSCGWPNGCTSSPCILLVGALAILQVPAQWFIPELGVTLRDTCMLRNESTFSRR
jgi:hypothetical protein